MTDMPTGERAEPKDGPLRRKAIKLILLGATACCLILSGCHVFPWYIPREYSREQKEEIYAFLRDELLAKHENYIAYVTYADPDDGSEHTADIWSCEEKLIIMFDLYTDHGHAVYYDGEYRHWDPKTERESVRGAEPDEWQFLFDKIERYATYYGEAVGGDFYDGFDNYMWECWPWGFGMAQVSYAADGEIFGEENAVINASWTVQNHSPLVHSAEFSVSTDYGVALQLYAEPYDIDQRIENVLASYEQHKRSADETSE